MFQSTHLQEVRLSGDVPLPYRLSVSIHAPTRGATFFDKNTSGLYLVSIHAPTRGATHCTLVSLISIRFQSTHLQEVRHFYKRHAGRWEKFQSTHLQEVRLHFCFWRFLCHSVSIHAPTRGATERLNTEEKDIVFQSTHLQEVRRRQS